MFDSKQVNILLVFALVCLALALFSLHNGDKDELAVAEQEMRDELSVVKSLLLKQTGNNVRNLPVTVTTEAAPVTDPPAECPFSPPSTTVQHNGGWMYSKQLIGSEHVAFDIGFGKSLCEYLGAATLYDIGAGVGQLEVFIRSKEAPIDIKSFDGGNNIMSLWDELTPLRRTFARVAINTEVEMLRLNHKVPHVCWIDAAKPFQLPPREWVISIEVGEHIDKAFEQTFIDNLVGAASKGVIVSWAVVGQGGHGHINTQNNPYIIEQFKKRGLRYDKEQTDIFRNAVVQNTWLEYTLMLFLK